MVNLNACLLHDFVYFFCCNLLSVFFSKISLVTVISIQTVTRMMLHSELADAIHHMQILGRFINAPRHKQRHLSQAKLSPVTPCPCSKGPLLANTTSSSLSGEGEGSSLFVSMELNGLTYQGILFQKGPTSS